MVRLLARITADGYPRLASKIRGTAARVENIGKQRLVSLAFGFAMMAAYTMAPNTSVAQTTSAVTLKANPAARGTQITLGDIFNNAGNAANVPLARAPGPGQRVVFGAPSLQSRAFGSGLRWTNGEGVREVVINGAARATTQSTAIPQSSSDAAPVTLAVLSRAIPRGAKIDASDVVWMDGPLNAPRDSIVDPEALIGKTAKRALLANTALRAADVMDTPAVRRGEPVTLMFEAGGLRLSLRGRAMGDAPIGGMIKVLNPQSNKTLDAIVESPGVARVLASQTSGRVVAQLGSN
jgi:flagellar basal body P-ring formation protein FlgA